MDVCTRIDSALKRLRNSKQGYQLCYGGGHAHAELINRQHVLRFLKMFFWCYGNWECAGKKYGHLGHFVSEMETASADDIEDWEGGCFYYQLQNKADHLIPEIKEMSLDFIYSSSIMCKSSTSAEFHEFLVTILENLENLLSSNAQMFVTVKEQIEILQQRLKFFRDLVKFTAERCISNEQELNVFRVQVQAWANRVACLLFLYWLDQNEEETVPNLKTVLLHVLETKPCTPVVKRVFLLALKASKSLQSERFLMGNLVANSVDLILEDLMASMEASVRTSIRDGLIILITFLMDPPPMKCGNEILAKAKDVVDHIFFGVPEEEGGIPSDRYILVIDFLKKINILKAEISKNYVQSPFVSLLNFPRTNGLGFIEFLLGNLKVRASSIIFAKSLIMVMQEKLLSVRAYIKDLMDQQNKIEELKHLWTRIINGAYMIEYVVDSFFFGDEPIWHNMIRLSILKDEFEFITTEVKKIRNEFVNNFRVHSVDELMCDRSEEDFVCTITKRGQASRMDELIVGFRNETIKIIDQLTRGSRELNVVSIVGMPGQGKTTLADKVYNDLAVKYHFHIRAWCFVSQAYQRRELLLNILSDMAVKDEMDGKSEKDLAKKLYQCLKERRYLIVMDDIWEIKPWHELKESFPNDNNGSRIMFTSRIHSIALHTKLDSSTHHLGPLAIEEGWELLQKKLFHDACCPPYLSEVGMEIVKNCQGLPLSIVAIAGVLARRVIDLNWWKGIESNLSSRILGETNSMDILELSYNHLPDYLKPCFLYFGSFRQGIPVNVKMLTQLWVVEGFIPKIGLGRPGDVARDFLDDLIDRSLVSVVNKSSSMTVKECRVHDLFFDLCLRKVEHDNFLKPLRGFQNGMEWKEYRLSIQITKWRIFVESNPTILFTRTLLYEDVTDGNPAHPFIPSFFMKFKFLRVMQDFYHRNYQLPKELISLIHLRYLVLSGVSSLPESIGNLQNLEVLRLGFSGMISVPDTIWEMKRLRHVHARPYAEFYLGNHLLERSKLNNVDTLSWPNICCGEYGEELLRRFPNVQKLRIQLVRNCQLPELGFLSNLESLNVCSISNGMKFLCDSKFPSTVKKLTLTSTELPWSEISVLGKLPNLEVLKLLLNSFVGKRWDVEDDDFLKLKFLKLDKLHIEEWKACTDPFPCLQRLVLRNCVLLQEIPSNFAEIPSLNVIEVHNCSRKAEISARNIVEEQVDFGNNGIQLLITNFDPEESVFYVSSEESEESSAD